MFIKDDLNIIIIDYSNVRLKISVNGVALSPEVGFLSTANTFRAGSAAVADRLKGNSVYVNSSNFVGIGTNDPKEKLDVVGGGIRIGSTEQLNAGTIRWTGSDFEGYNGNKWLSLTANNNPVNGTVIQAVAGETINGGITPVPVYMRSDELILGNDSLPPSIFDDNFLPNCWCSDLFAFSCMSNYISYIFPRIDIS